MDIKVFILLTFQIQIVRCVKCYICDSVTLPGVCDFQVYKTEQILKNISNCSDTCFVGALKNNTDEAYLRKCGNSIIGCDKRPGGFICQCSTDYCNQNLEVCKQNNRCSKTLFPFEPDI